MEDSAADEAEPLESVPVEDEVDGNMPAANRDVSYMFMLLLMCCLWSS